MMVRVLTNQPEDLNPFSSPPQLPGSPAAHRGGGDGALPPSQQRRRALERVVGHGQCQPPL
jgi:hypothetical protein